MTRMPLVVHLLILSTLTTSFIIQLPKNHQKCFYTSIDPANVVLVKFGLPRNNHYPCQVRIWIGYEDEGEGEGEVGETGEMGLEDQHYAHLYNMSMLCEERKPGQLTIFKYFHSPSKSAHTTYKICLKNLKDLHQNKTQIELIITEQQDPAMGPISPTDNHISPSQFMDLSAMVQHIAKRLSWCSQALGEAGDAGKQVDFLIGDYGRVVGRLEWIQIAFLIFYAVLWTMLMKYNLDPNPQPQP